jgi:hypothetical protein
VTRSPVKSSSLLSVGYDPAMRVLEVEFAGGRVYQHHGVSSEQHANLLGAKSAGSYYHEHLKGRYGPPKESA